MRLLGFEGLIENSLDAVSSRDFAIEAVACLANLNVEMARMAEDLILWSTWEYGYIELADEYSSTSSIMPQKKNPCPLELIRGKTGAVYSALMNLLSQVKGIPSGYNRDLQESKIPIKISFETIKSSLKVLAGVYETMKINHGRLREAVDEGLSTSVDLAEALSMRYDLPFRETHIIVGKIVMKLAEQGLKMKDVKPEDVEKASLEVLGKEISITSKELQSLIDPEECVSRRRSRGSPSTPEVKRLLKSHSKIISKFEVEHQRLMRAIKESKSALREMVKKYLD